jgi:hypothetical protein
LSTPAAAAQLLRLGIGDELMEEADGLGIFADQSPCPFRKFHPLEI